MKKYFGQVGIVSAGMAGALVASAVLLVWQGVPLQATESPLSDELPIVELVARALPSVVSISGEFVDADGQITVDSRGSGFIVDSTGLIVTNRHVVPEIDGISYYVEFDGGPAHLAEVVGRDPLNDLALVKVSGREFPALPLGDSESLRIGQTTIAIGNSLGRYQNTVTKGIISGLGRFTVAEDRFGVPESLINVIQTDAAINFGNSGGPLVNSRGEVIGVNTAIEERGRGVGLAIPVEEVHKVVASYREFGRVVRPYLGVRFIMVNRELQREFALPYDYGALIIGGSVNEPTVIPGGPADQAGFFEGDLILTVNDQLVRDDLTLLVLIQRLVPGDTPSVMVWRAGGLVTLTPTLVELGAE